MATVARQVGFLLIGYRHPDTDAPLELGEVFTYLDGTSTKSALWTARDKSARANNPITLDSQGRAEVYGDNVYKFEIYEKRNDDGTIGAHLETINGLDLFATVSSEIQWSVQETDVIAYGSATSFTVVGDETDKYEVGRRIRAEGTTTGIIYGTISSSSYAGGTNKTTVTVAWDSGSLNDESLDVAIGILTVTEPSSPRPQTKTVTSATALDYTDYGKTVLIDYSGGSFDIALPAHLNGWWVKFVVIDATNSGNIDDSGGVAQVALSISEETTVLMSDGSAWHAQYPLQHAPRHKGGGSDELDAVELSGAGGTAGQIVETDGAGLSYVEPDDRYTPAGHGSRHQNNGSDEINVGGLSGDLADAQDPKSHASTHKDSGSDELDASELAGALGTAGDFLKSDGNGANWVSEAIAQGDLKTTTGEVSRAGTNAGNEVLPGGQYGFYVQTKVDGYNGTVSFANSCTNTSYKTNVYLTNAEGTATTYALQRYIQSSPPYDFGDGVVMGFVYLQLDSNGKVIGTYIAEDPPWYGNTRNCPERQYKTKDGKEYAKFWHSKFERTGDLADFGKIEAETLEITTALKLRGMEELPQPFEGSENVVLLDPVDEKLTYRIVQEMLAGGNPTEIFRKNYAEVDSTKLERKGPPNVAIHKAKWK